MLSWWLPENLSTYGTDGTGLFAAIFWLTIAGYAIVQTWMLTSFVIATARRPVAGARAAIGREILWCVVSTVILALLAISTQRAWSGVHVTSTAAIMQTATVGGQR